MIINCTVTSMHRRDERFMPLNQVRDGYNEHLKTRHPYPTTWDKEKEVARDKEINK